MGKKILILGGSFFQIPVIRYAREAGYYVVTCDFIPENPGHKLADEYHNVSTTDLEGVLALAARLKIAGILAYASDPAAPTAAYVSEKLGLPGNSYDCVRTMANKDQYRAMLARHGFAAPKAAGGLINDRSFLPGATLRFPLMVKPVDSSGSKGVSRVDTPEGLPAAMDYAGQFSRAKRVVVEEFVRRKGPQIGGEAFVVDGRLVFICLGDQRVDANSNPYVPTGMTFPSRIAPPLAEKIFGELQRLITALGYNRGGLNLEIMLDDDEKVFLMEIGPRTGGNFLPELVRHATGFDLAAVSVESALGNSLEKYLPEAAISRANDAFAYYAIHSSRSGALKALQIDASVRAAIIELHQFVPVGGRVQVFNGSNCTIGIILFRFGTLEKMYEMMPRMNRYVQVEVDEVLGATGERPTLSRS